MGEVIKSITIKLSLNRLQALLALLGLVIILAAFQFAKAGLFSQAYAYALKSEVEIKVTGDDDKPLPATVSLINTKKAKYEYSAIADAEGFAKLPKMVAGNYKIDIKYTGYKFFTVEAKIKRGKNSTLTYQLQKKPPEESTVSGTVKNYVSEVGVAGVTVEIDGKSAVTDASGNFSIQKVISGEKEVKIKQSGYLDFSKTMVIEGKTVDLKVLSIVPAGKIVYCSNKDKGKRAIYTSNYDGSDSKALIARVGETEDFAPEISPDFKKVAFLSTRDGKKDGSNDINVLYVVDADGKNLTRIGESSDYGFYWTSNSKSIVWSSLTKENNQNKFTYSVYNVGGKNNATIFSGNYTISSAINADNTKIAYVMSGLSPSGKYELNLYDIAANTSAKVYEDTTSFYLISYASGTEVIFSSYRDGQTKYYSVNPNDGTAKETTYQYPKRIGKKSPNGKLLIYIDQRDGKSNLFAADDLNGRNEKQVTNIDDASESFWSADSQYVFIKAFKQGESALYIVNLDGGSAKKVVDIASGGSYYGM